MRVVIEFDWEDIGAIGLSAVGKLDIPPVPAEPGIYRFQVSNASGTEVYIGESQNLRHRMLRNYANKHKGRTNVRIRELLLQHLAKERAIRLAIVSRVAVEIDGEQISADLNSKNARRLVENAALAHARRAGESIHNL